MQLKVNNSTWLNQQVWISNMGYYTFAYGTNPRKSDSGCSIYVYGGLKHINIETKKKVIVYKLVPTK